MKFEISKQMIATLLKDADVQRGIEKASKEIQLPEPDSVKSILEHLGSQIFNKGEW